MISLVQLVGGLVLLLFGAEYLVRGAVALARRLKVTPMIIGMTVSYGTTSPELVVSLQAAVDGLPGPACQSVFAATRACDRRAAAKEDGADFSATVKGKILSATVKGKILAQAAARDAI